jgi:hypothetical protein
MAANVTLSSGRMDLAAGRRARRLLGRLICTLILSGCIASAAHALVVQSPGTETTSAPPIGVLGTGLWNNVAGSGSPNYVYLGNGWAITAWHVFQNNPVNSQLLTFGVGGTYGIIPNQTYNVPNPSGSGLTPFTDLTLVRLKGDPGLPAVPIASVALSNSDLNQPTANVTFAGQGPTRHINNPDIPESWTGHLGYYGQGDYTKRWGQNKIGNEDIVDGCGSDTNNLRCTVQINYQGNLRDIVSMFTYFDQAGLTYEAQVIGGDSGSAVFHNNGSQWELIGIVNTMLGYPGQPSDFAAYNSGSSFADLTYYRSEIQNIMNGHTNFSVVGDVNLDGSVTGNGTGPWASDDITAFIQGWRWQQAQANVESWKKGDLNLDGLTNVTDFFLMRNAAINAGLGAGASALSGLMTQVVPEPSSLVLIAGALFVAVGRWRRLRK